MTTHTTRTDFPLDISATHRDNRLEEASAALDHPASSSPAILFIPEGKPLPPASRLLVLVPPATPHTLASCIWSLASTARVDVLFVGVIQDANDDYSMRRCLATLAAATRDNRFQVNTRLVQNKSWLRTVRQLWQPGDLVVCFAEQTVSDWGFRRRSLAQTLIARLNSPVYVLTGLSLEGTEDQPGFITRLLRFSLPFLIILGFFALQVQIEQLPKNWAYYTLMILSVLVELTLISIWH